MSHLRCPLCHQSLVENQQGVACINRHHFDCAKEGYINLLPVQHKRSLEPGDSEEQLSARRKFLRAGFFDPLKQRLEELFSVETKTLLDIGCGEGYFTEAIAGRLPDTLIYGIDIAKVAIRLAAKTSKTKGRPKYFVASSADLPFEDHSMDIILRLFAPSNDQEINRVLKTEGRLIIISPGESHLLGLRSRIYEHVNLHAAPMLANSFELIDQENLKGKFVLRDPEMFKALLNMTPFSWSLSMEKKLDLLANFWQPETGSIIDDVVLDNKVAPDEEAAQRGHFADNFDFLISTYRLA